MKTWHIIGANGYIASRLIPKIPAGVNVIRYTHSGDDKSIPLELTKLNDDNFSQIHPGDYVVYLAAVSSPDVCRDHYEFAYRINVEGTKTFISKCAAIGANVLFFSSDAVIGPTKEPADENYNPHPFGSYGKMKREIEMEFLGNEHVKVFRLSYVLSRQDKFISYLVKCVRNGEIADVFSALYRNVIYLEDVIDAIIELADTFELWPNSIFNICGTQLLSRSNLAEIFQCQVEPDLQYQISMPDEKFFEARPNVIETKSLYLADLLKRKPTEISKAISMEFLQK